MLWGNREGHRGWARRRRIATLACSRRSLIGIVIVIATETVTVTGERCRLLGLAFRCVGTCGGVGLRGG